MFIIWMTSLAQAQGLTSDDVAVLDGWQRAQNVAQGLIEQARKRIEVGWGLKPSEQHVARNPVNFWHHVQQRREPPKPVWPARTWFQRQCGRDYKRDPAKRRNAIAFGAGAVFEEGRHPRPGREPDQEWLERMTDQGFEYARRDPGEPFFFPFRWLPLKELASDEDFSAQVDVVVQRALDSLRMLPAGPATKEMCEANAGGERETEADAGGEIDGDS